MSQITISNIRRITIDTRNNPHAQELQPLFPGDHVPDYLNDPRFYNKYQSPCIFVEFGGAQDKEPEQLQIIGFEELNFYTQMLGERYTGGRPSVYKYYSITYNDALIEQFNNCVTVHDASV